MKVNLDRGAYYLDHIGEHFREGRHHVAGSEAIWQLSRIADAFRDKIVYLNTDYSDKGKKSAVRAMVVRLEDGVWMEISNVLEGCERTHVRVHAHDCGVAKEWLSQLCAKYTTTSKRRAKLSFHMLMVAEDSPGGLRSIAVEIRHSFPLKDDQMALHYGDAFPRWAGALEIALRQRMNGLCLLQGEPGTGKTSFIRHLVYSLRRTHRVFYIPTEYAHLLSSPRTIPFWLHQRAYHPRHKPLIVLEDAENLIMPRGQDNRAQVANILNLSDGLLGECVRVQLLCTVNCTMDKLDPAITRHGRLIAHRTFQRLNPREANRLAESLGVRLPDQPDYSLAEIYNQERGPVLLEEKKCLGFAA